MRYIPKSRSIGLLGLEDKGTCRRMSQCNSRSTVEMLKHPLAENLGLETQVRNPASRILSQSETCFLPQQKITTEKGRNLERRTFATRSRREREREREKENVQD